MAKDRKPKTPRERFIFREHECPYCKSLRLYATGGLQIVGDTRIRPSSCRDCKQKFTMLLVRNS